VATITEQEKRNVWLSFATAAIGGFCSKSGMKVSDRAAEMAADIADEMLHEFLETFEEGYKRPEGGEDD
jgi:hypothetical protein